MDKAIWLVYASIAVWVVLGLYLFLLSRKQKNIEKRLQHIEMLGRE